MPNQLDLQGTAPVLYVSQDPTVNATLEVVRKQMAESGWYRNGIVVPTKRNRLEKAIGLASGNASRNVEIAHATQQELAAQVSEFAGEVVKSKSFGYVLSQDFKAVLNSFATRFKRLGEVINNKRAKQSRNGAR